jgi:type IV pilus assembly protein PilV
MIEVMMGLAILAVGATGVIALQKTAALGTVTSRHLSNATNISRSVIEAAEADAMQWTDNTANLGPVGWLNPGGGLGLAAPSDVADPPWYTLPVNSFSLNLEPLDPMAADPIAVAYCTQVRVSWLGLKAPPPPALESTAVRLEVRTIFARSPRDISAECNPANVGNVTNLLAGTDEYGAVYLTTVIRRGQ